MSDPGPQMKPQDTTNFLLGGMQEQLKGIADEQKTARQENTDFRADIRVAVAGLRTDVDVLKAAQPLRVSPWSKAGVIIALPASVVALVGFIIVYLNPTP